MDRLRRRHRREASSQPLAWLLRLHHRGRSNLLLVGGNVAQRLRVARLFCQVAACPGAPLIRVDCAHEEPTLRGALEDWLSGARSGPGAALLRAAETGTLYLDSIGRLSPAVQRLLCAVIARRPCEPLADDREAWCGRLIAGSSSPLDGAVASGRFSGALLDALDKIRFEIRHQEVRGAA